MVMIYERYWMVEEDRVGARRGRWRNGNGIFSLFFLTKKKKEKNAKDRQGMTKPPRTKNATE